MPPLVREESAGYLTNWAARLFARAIDRKLKPLGLSSGQLPVFFALADSEAMTQTALARAASIEQPTMAATLARMERQGLITRKKDPDDKRSSLVTLSAAARAKVPAVMEATSAVNAAALAGLAPEERARFLRDLKAVIAALEEE